MYTWIDRVMYDISWYVCIRIMCVWVVLVVLHEVLTNLYGHKN